MGFGVLPVLAAALGFALYKAVRSTVRASAERRRLDRELHSRPALTTGSVEGDVVRVTGIVRPIDSLIAPLSGRSCVMYRSRVDNANVFGTQTWDVRIASSITPFYLDREDGDPVRVDGQAIVELGGVPISDPDRKRQFLLSQGVTRRERGWPRFEEVIVEAGMQVSIVGLMSIDDTQSPSPAERGFRDPQPSMVRLIGDPTHPLIIGPAKR
jgi:hypothetical protein